MDDIVDRLFHLLDTLRLDGVLTKEDEETLASIEKDYKFITQESNYVLTCPVCGNPMKF